MTRTQPDFATLQLLGLVVQHVRLPSEHYVEDGAPVFIFDPPLTVVEQETFDRLMALSRSAVQVTPTEWASLQNELDGLRTYHALATPTAAQTTQAVKAIIRVLRALLRD